MNDKIKNYLEKLPSPQKEICEKARTIILKTYPDIKESFKNGVPWYEDQFYYVGLKDHVNIGFSVSDLTAEQMNKLEGKGKYMRHIKIHSMEEINERELVKLLKMVRK